MKLSAEMTTTVNTPRCQYSHQTLFGWSDDDVIMLTWITIIIALCLVIAISKHQTIDTTLTPRCISQISGRSSRSYCHIKVTPTLLPRFEETGHEISPDFCNIFANIAMWVLQFCVHAALWGSVQHFIFHIHINWRSGHEHKMISLKKCFIIPKHITSLNIWWKEN